MTKLFTATAVVQLSEGGAVDLDAPVSRYLPERQLVREGREATVRDLLSHSSGLPNPIPIQWIHLANEPGPTLDEQVARVVPSDAELDFVPGTDESYSNLGYLLLGQIIERVSKQRFEEYVEARILRPLGCEDTGFSAPQSAATGHQSRFGVMSIVARWFVADRFFDEPKGAYWPLKRFTVDGAPYGGLIGSMRDLLRFARMMLSGGQGENGRVLSPNSVAALLAPPQGRQIGLGWQFGMAGDEPFAGHMGGGGGFRSEIRIYPHLGYAVAVLSNETSFPTGSLAKLVVR